MSTMTVIDGVEYTALDLDEKYDHAQLEGRKAMIVYVSDKDDSRKFNKPFILTHAPGSTDNPRTAKYWSESFNTPDMSSWSARFSRAWKNSGGYELLVEGEMPLPTTTVTMIENEGFIPLTPGFDVDYEGINGRMVYTQPDPDDETVTGPFKLEHIDDRPWAWTHETWCLTSLDDDETWRLDPDEEVTFFIEGDIPPREVTLASELCANDVFRGEDETGEVHLYVMIEHEDTNELKAVRVDETNHYDPSQLVALDQ